MHHASCMSQAFSTLLVSAGSEYWREDAEEVVQHTAIPHCNRNMSESVMVSLPCELNHSRAAHYLLQLRPSL